MGKATDPANKGFKLTRTQWSAKGKMMWSDIRNLQRDAFSGSSLSLRRWVA